MTNPINEINDLLAHDSESRASSTMRSLLLDAPDFDTPLDDLIDDDFDTTPEIAHALRTALISLYADKTPTAIDFISQNALALSLCPMHLCDYAICFDDDDADCSQIRQCFPLHDT